MSVLDSLELKNTAPSKENNKNNSPPREYMLRRSAARCRWIGGTLATAPVLGTNMQPDTGKIINVEKAVVSSDWSVDPAALAGNYQNWRWERYYRELRADLYDELLKLPLRYKMHPFEALHAAMSQSAVGYAAPLGPADPYDTIPFFVHRMGDGNFATRVRSLDKKAMMPVYSLSITRVDGDLLRFEDELVKIFPSKKIFTSANHVKIFNAAEDARAITELYFLGLGF